MIIWVFVILFITLKKKRFLFSLVLGFKNYCKDVICFMSKDDPYITFDELKKFAESVNGKMIIKENSGHFNEKAGYKTFPEILKYV